MATLSTKLSSVIGDKTAKAFADGFGYFTVGDLLRHYPRRYLVRGELSDISALHEGDETTILAEVFSSNLRRFQGRKGNLLEVIVTDGTAKLSLTFFNQAWREKELQVGRQGLFAGKVGVFNGKRQLAHPDYELIADGSDVDSAVDSFAGKYIPMYPATSKLPSWKIAQSIELAIAALDEIDEYIPRDILDLHTYPELHQSMVQIHKPVDLESAERAKERLTFDEAFLLQLLLLRRRHEQQKLITASRAAKSGGILDAFDASLPFQLTAGQREVSREIESDLAQPHPMYRLLQGEVGSGKTIVALRAALTVVDNGGQAAILAPTEVLAAQHLRTITKLLGPLAQGGMLGSTDIATQVTLITGSQSTAARREALELAADGRAGIVIGTHALLGESVAFKDLGLIIIDEQHRFGVEQRDALKAKAMQPPHFLVMTATPIPRTVAMTVFGDLDVSTLRELPLGRQPIQSHVIAELEKPTFLTRAWERIREEVSHGQQAYVVAPRISAGISEDADLDFLMGESSTPFYSVDELAPELATGVLKGLSVAPLHGRMPAELKDSTMQAFSEKKIDVLISTTVIEVGVDVPNATVMVIMDADRFGVSQLHQLRGRVGRGTSPGLCLLVTKVASESPTMERLLAVAGTTDGFELSKIDLEQRREGDVLGTSQSGAKSHLRLLQVVRDEKLIENARSDAAQILERDINQYSNLLQKLTELEYEESSRFIEKS